MSLTAEVKGKSADRFRAYSAAPMTRRMSAKDILAYIQKNGDAPPDAARVSYSVEHPEMEGTVSGSTVSISAGDKTITRVVFYKDRPANKDPAKGAIETADTDDDGKELPHEAVVGSVIVNASGSIVIELVEPKDPNEIVLIDEADLA